MQKPPPAAKAALFASTEALHACADAKLGPIDSAIAIPEIDRAAESRAEEILGILINWKRSRERFLFNLWLHFSLFVSEPILPSI